MSFDPEHAKILRQVSLFAGLEAKELQGILLAARLVQVEEGSYYFMQGDPAAGIFVLIEGRVKLVQVSLAGQQVLMGVVLPPGVFGVVSLLEGGEFPVSAAAMQNSKALFWSAADIQQIASSHPAVAMNTIRVLAEQVQDFQARFRELATERVERRLARTVIRLANQAGRKTAEGVLIDLPLTRQDLAEISGTTLYTVSRILSQWEERGIVQAGRERVVVRFPHGLVMIADDLA